MPKITLFDRWSMWLSIQWEKKWFVKVLIIFMIGWIFVISGWIIFFSLLSIGAIKGDPELWKKIKKLKKDPTKSKKLFKTYKKYYGY